MSDFGDTTWPMARKAHRCEWCAEAIPAGEKHAKFAGVWEGDWNFWRMHSECYDYGMTSGEISDGFSPYEHERPAKP